MVGLGPWHPAFGVGFFINTELCKFSLSACCSVQHTQIFVNALNNSQYTSDWILLGGKVSILEEILRRYQLILKQIL